MSTNCTRCITRLRTGADLLCDECRALAAKVMCPRCMPPGDPCCPYCNGTYEVTLPSGAVVPGKWWRQLSWSECPSCGSTGESFTENSDGDGGPLPADHAYDGDSVRCVECGHPGCVSADEDWAHVQWHDDPEGNCCDWCRAQVVEPKNDGP